MAFENAKKAGIIKLLTALKGYFLQIKDAVKSVNSIGPDDDGDIQIDYVPYAGNIQSESSSRSTDAFIQRMAGGESAIGDGDAWLVRIKGNNDHDGYVPEYLEMNVTPMERENPITAVIDRDTLVAYMAESGTVTLTYSTDWSEDPALYGVTVTGTPVAGDIIVISYTKEERGTITVANPSAFVATGWNLFDYVAGYAKVIKYSDGYRVAGTYTKLQFSATLTGAKTDIVVTDGNFDIPYDGYVWVTGGNGENTAIYATWEDWSEGYQGDFKAYSESVIDLSDVMAEYFPYGLLKAGDTVDEIDLNLGQVISRVERIDYSEANRAIAAASGREYEFDEDYIYLARATATPVSVTIDGAFAGDDHGIEYFSDTDVEVVAETLYGVNLKNRLERDALLKGPQNLSAETQAQVRENIGAQEAMVFSDITSSAWTWGQAYVTGDNPSGSFLALGRLRMLRFTITPKSTQTTWTTIGTVAEGHRPSQYISTYGIESVASPTPKHIRLKPDGTCEIYARGTSTYSANLIWFV